MVLLTKAVHATYVLDQLHRLAASDPRDDPIASARVADAITSMTQVRATLIRNADRLIQASSHPDTRAADVTRRATRRPEKR
jgi:hypothetical protein